ncbi:hypothetical protein GGI03_008282, partial [Coemansia sp. RSA 2337]
MLEDLKVTDYDAEYGVVVEPMAQLPLIEADQQAHPQERRNARARSRTHNTPYDRPFPRPRQMPSAPQTDPCLQD